VGQPSHASSPYRAASVRSGAPAELTLTARIPEAFWLAATRVGGQRLLMTVPVIFAIGILGTANLVFAFVLLVFIAYAIWLRGQYAKSFARTMLRVADGELMLTLGDATPLRRRLADLRALRVDTETQKAFAIRGYGVHATTLGTGIARGRVVLELTGETEPLPLSEPLLSNTDCVEWVPRVYRFLRGHGWIPDDEREAPPSEPREALSGEP
jgi:hypothetical protein